MDKSSSRPSRPTRDLRELLADDIQALIRYAHVAPSEEAVAITRRLLSDGSWADAVGDLRGLLDNKLVPLSAWLTIASEVLQVILDDHRTQHEIRAETHDLIELLGRRGTDEVRERLVSWFLEVAGPSEARLAIDLLRNGLDRPDGYRHAFLRRWCKPLTKWLVDRGPAELARGNNPLVMLHVIETCRADFPDRLGGALRILEHSDKPDAVLTVDGAGERIIHPAVEAALEAGLPIEWVDQVFGGAYAALNSLGYERFFAPLDPVREMPRLRGALLDALAHGRWRSGFGIEVWKRAFMHAPPTSLSFDDDGFATALQALVDARYETAISDEALAAWTEVIVEAWFARFGLRRPSATLVPGVWSLDILAAEPRLAPGIARAFIRELAAAPPDDPRLSAAREVMERGAAAEPRLASVALLRLPSGPEPWKPRSRTSRRCASCCNRSCAQTGRRRWPAWMLGSCSAVPVRRSSPSRASWARKCSSSSAVTRC
jgi:hypothetical protein